MSAEHHHHHEGCRHGGGGQLRAVRAAFLITFIFMLVEAAGALLTGSMALWSDSLHMLTDAASLGMSFFAARVALLRPDHTRTFGYRRAEVVAALANAMLLWVLCGYMLREVYGRFGEPVPVLSVPMMAVAAAGLAANLACAWILHSGGGDSINVRGALLHVLSDLAGSAAALAAGAVIYFTGWYRADTLVSIFIIVLILIGSGRLLSEAFHILMEGAPAGIRLEELRERLLAVDGVSGVHDLHAWTLSTGFHALSAHLVVRDPARNQPALEAAAALAAEFGLKHTVFQVETSSRANSSCDSCGR